MDYVAAPIGRVRAQRSAGVAIPDRYQRLTTEATPDAPRNTAGAIFSYQRARSIERC